MQIKADLWTMNHALFLKWESLKILVEYKLGALLKRNIQAAPFQDEDSWEVGVSPIEPDEMELLFETAGADKEDRENHSGDKLAFDSLTGQFTMKLIAAEFPFPVRTAIPTENGIYFIDQGFPYPKTYLI